MGVTFDDKLSFDKHINLVIYNYQHFNIEYERRLNYDLQNFTWWIFETGSSYFQTYKLPDISIFNFIKKTVKRKKENLPSLKELLISRMLYLLL